MDRRQAELIPGKRPGTRAALHGVAYLILFLLACSSPPSGTNGSQLNFDAIATLPGVALSNVEGLNRVAESLDFAAVSRSNSPLWLGAAEQARAAARTLSVLADNAKAVMRMRQQNLNDPGGMLSDGLSLLRPGETLSRQADARL